MSSELEPTITLTREDDWWVARDTDTGVVTQGRTSHEALENLEEAVAGYRGEGREPTDDELRELGIDPDDNVSGSLEDSPIFE